MKARIPQPKVHACERSIEVSSAFPVNSYGHVFTHYCRLSSPYHSSFAYYENIYMLDCDAVGCLPATLFRKKDVTDAPLQTDVPAS